MKQIGIFLLSIIFVQSLFSQDSSQRALLDKVDVIVNDKIILHSDIENQLDLLNLRGVDEKENRCLLMEQLIHNKLLTTQALRDSLPLSMDEVEEELNRKINYFISVAGSQEAFEEYYHKSVEQIKDDYRDDIREQMLAARMRNKILEDLKVTPSEVKLFFDKMSKDSLPYFNATVEVQQIVMKPRVSDEQEVDARTKSEDLLKRLKDGENFELLAGLYSDDMGSAKQGGLMDWAPRGTFVKEFEAAAFKLKAGEISGVVKTQFGYHIIQMVERRGDMIQVKHILKRPMSTSKDAEFSYNKLDSIRADINNNKITFFEAVKEYSEDKPSKGVGGFLLNYETGGTVLEVNNIDPELYRQIDTMQIGSISAPIMFQGEDGTPSYRIVKLVSRTAPHIADIKIDYDKIQNAARADKEEQILEKWYGKNLKKTYLMITDDYTDCEVLQSLIPK